MNNPYSADQHPDLSLARTPDVASGSSLTNMPVPLPTIPREQPMLQSAHPYQDIHLMGIVDNVPFYDLNLAGVNPLPNPPYNAASGDEIHAPTFGTQNYDVPANKPFDLQGPGIDWRPPLVVDPYVGDLLQFDQPHGTDILASSHNPLAIDPVAPDLSLYDRPANLSMPGPLMVDPALPNLQQPLLDQQVRMLDRPADLSELAMSIMHTAPTYDQIPAESYEALWMTQSGNNQTRERHLGMLMLGLDREEGK